MSEVYITQPYVCNNVYKYYLQGFEIMTVAELMQTNYQVCLNIEEIKNIIDEMNRIYQ